MVVAMNEAQAILLAGDKFPQYQWINAFQVVGIPDAWIVCDITGDYAVSTDGYRANLLHVVEERR
jgi:hypothetical protein